MKLESNWSVGSFTNVRRHYRNLFSLPFENCSKMALCETIFIMFFAIVLSSHRVQGENTQRIVAPYNVNREIELRPGYQRWLTLPEGDSKEIAQMMLRKNFSILMEFKQQEHTHGTLYAVYSGSSKLLEFQSDGPKGELKAAWRRSNSLSNLNIQNIELDDDTWHQIIYEIHGDQLSLTVDCVETGYSGAYPEIDFSLFNRTNKPVHVWVTQRDQKESLLIGKLKQFKVQSGSFYNQICRPSYIVEAERKLTSSTNLDPTPNARVTVINPDSLAELSNRVKHLETELKRYQSVTNVPSSTVEPHPSVGVCPNCYEYLRYKANYLESELRRWRDHLEKVEKSLQRVLLVQRGCLVDGNYLDNGETWLNNCTECICNLGKPMCRPVGCQRLPCKIPLLLPGQCCPICGQNCTYSGKTFEHGQHFWSEPCVRCRCNAGDVSCAFMRTNCPTLNCTVDNQIVPDNQCCPICDDEVFCQTRPCHKDATCTAKKHGRDCECNLGFFGDGEENCFDIDECKWAPEIAEQLGGCGSGSRCINTPGNFHCECLPGYTKISNRTCLDVIIL